MNDERKYYVLCEANCKFESMTKEQILTAIKQAAETGSVGDVDTGFVTKIVELNKRAPLSFWVGTSAEYNAIAEKAQNCFYIITDDTTGDDLKAAIEELQTALRDIEIRVSEFNSIAAEIIVNTYGGTVVCKYENGSQIAGARVGGSEFLWKFKVYEYGRYTFENTIGDHTNFAHIDIYEAKQHVITIEDYDDDFAANSWEKIIRMCQSGNVPDTWQVGDYKQVGGDSAAKNWYISILGKNHDTYTDTGERAPITFIAETMQSGSSNFKMNTTATNDGGWKESYMRNTLLVEYLDKFPTAIKEAIRAVDKRTTCGNKSAVLETTSDKLFLFSEVENLGANVYAIAGEGEQYEYFRNGNILADTDACWTRSPCYMNTMAFACRDQFEEETTPPYAECATANSTKTQTKQTTLSFAPCFCF